MFGSIVAALIPLVGAIFSVGTGLALVGLLAAATNLPTTAPTVATLLGLGVAVDYGLFLVARHREQLDHGMGMEDSIGEDHGDLRAPRSSSPAARWWSRSSASTSPTCRSSGRSVPPRRSSSR